MTAPTTRPSLAKKRTRKGDEQRDAMLDRGIAFTDDDGTRLAVRVGDVRGVHDAALVRVVGTDFMGLLDRLTQRQGLDLLAAVVWFARFVNGRNDGSQAAYEACLDEVGYEDWLGIDEPQERDGPEA